MQSTGAHSNLSRVKDNPQEAGRAFPTGVKRWPPLSEQSLLAWVKGVGVGSALQLSPKETRLGQMAVLIGIRSSLKKSTFSQNLCRFSVCGSKKKYEYWMKKDREERMF